MAMVRNESVARIVMFLCFGTAILSLAVHWRVTSTLEKFEKPTSATGNRPGSFPGKFAGSIGQTALGASTPPEENTQEKPAQKTSNVRPDNMSGQVSQNVAEITDVPKNMRLSAPGQKQKQNEYRPKFFLPQFLPQQKSSNKLEVMKTEVVVDLSDRRTYVYTGNIVMASYPIAVGKQGWETPTGSFEVRHKQHDPIWRHPITGKIFPPGADSPLGERWIGFWSDGRNEIGFHGTPDIHLLGTAISHGCLRMRNADVRLLYEQVKVGTLVTVRD
ncbi:L,D-transpeptidase [Halotia branconii]|uniref:L,D-transpeptidase n=1 Tax=Halotia branconii CENA392 TaxID=1539056 RepID=A0AAJ6NUD0_9CYAN|nr:L,D-transpeptidase [Halotia branconii]WGV26797.1 L,D-transpeptidase [Halotia branconii CENA392]